MDTRKLEAIQIRATAEFKNQVKAAAARDGMQMSAWIERTLREAMERPAKKRAGGERA
jgi:predicted HicB family RNase H-like nuclease